jgi:SAM-dependent methyltransferase
MSHQSQLDFVRSLTHRFPIYFAGQRVLEVGSLDINGSIRQFFDGCEYIGVDLGEGKGVDLVAKGEDLDFPDGYFKVVASCECFEHNPEWEATFRNMIRMCSGLVFFSCATTGRLEHGTKRTSPDDAPFCGDYYRNLTEEDFREKFTFEEFESYGFLTNSNPADLYFWGIKTHEHLLEMVERTTTGEIR